jgi:hypothetical protein
VPYTSFDTTPRDAPIIFKTVKHRPESPTSGLSGTLDVEAALDRVNPENLFIHRDQSLDTSHQSVSAA